MTPATEYIQLRQCSSKHAYPNQHQAGRALKRLDPKRKTGLHVYRCPHCHHWHLGRSRPLKARRRKFRPLDINTL